MKKKIAVIFIPFLLFVLVWDLYVRFLSIPSYILPSPGSFLIELLTVFRQGEIYTHIYTTLYEIAIGMLLGVLLGLFVGYLVAKSRLIERILNPYIIIIQIIPKISIAPLFLLWFGLGANSKIAIIILVVFFPIMVNLIVGLRSIDRNVHALLKLVKVNRWQKFRFVEVMYALPAIISGVKVACTYAITGAVIGEMLGAQSGLGYLVMLGSETNEIQIILTSVFLLCIIGLILYLMIDLFERKLLGWHETRELPLN
ncbi:ABC transporter permease [Halalkalibacter okhensis]|uniref:ABC transporter permease n=1 Tax=Halalkalibacter okhensis TaxID=333138 RepID=A0A0B0IDR7_9BACI|nr:ABC transporter permease [Halalkalibacter okhensis]KHF37806.1 ABC transporter permease [Halalkalibacter okhensis]